MEGDSKGAVMSDQEVAAGWDADHRLAARVAFVAGLLAILGAAVWSTLGMAVAAPLIEGRPVGAFQVTAVAGVLLLTDIALLAFVVGLAHAVSATRSFELVLSSAVASLATTVSATLHLVWGYAASSLELTLPPEVVHFITWLALNLWFLPLYALLVGATLVALWLALRRSRLRFARRLGTASAVIGAALCVLGPFTGFAPDQPAFVAVAVILLACAGIGVLVLVAEVRLGLLLWGTRAVGSPHNPSRRPT
jgi:hypothetical protein